MVHSVPYEGDNFISLVRYNKESVFLIASIDGVLNLSTCKLKNDGIQGPVPAKKNSENHQHKAVPDQNVIPDGFSSFFRNKY